ncbi:hypothetical protein ON010_g8750 [Phytophthora cinnamomi]|nr:hypothetical protein ON010_g8750 [Phytophthora cinnamomi]
MHTCAPAQSQGATPGSTLAARRSPLLGRGTTWPPRPAARAPWSPRVWHAAPRSPSTEPSLAMQIMRIAQIPLAQ